MPKGTEIMFLVVNVFLLLFSASLVFSDQNTVPLRSFKISENVTYDCIDIYKQPGLDHPLLKNHTIQLTPSASRPEIKNQISNNTTSKIKIKVECPDGTVPVLRNTAKIITNTKNFAKKYFHMLSADSPGTHIAGIQSRNGPFHGIEAEFDAYHLNVRKDQASYSQIYVGSGLNKQVNYISAGMMINPSVFSDGRVWSYGFWKGKNGKGCYNTLCPGFVQVSNKVPIVAPFNLRPGESVWSYHSIHKDKQTGNWWITQRRPNLAIGYWPKELFNLLDDGASMVGVGGVVQASHSGPSPPMGNGKFPNEDIEYAAVFKHIEVLNSNYKPSGIYSFPTDKLFDSTKCYRLIIGKRVPVYSIHFGDFFNYGGPGGNSCGT